MFSTADSHYVLFLRNGCIMMSVSITYSYLTQLWRIGSVKIQAYAQWEKRAGMQG